MALKSLGVPMDPLEWVGQGDLALLNEHKTELFHGPPGNSGEGSEM